MHAVLVRCNKTFVWNTPFKSLSALHSFRQYPLLIVIAIDLDRLFSYTSLVYSKKIHFKDRLMLMEGAEVAV